MDKIAYIIKTVDSELVDKPKEVDPLDMLMKGVISGAAIGAGIALNSKFKGVKLRNEKYLKDTEATRNIFNNIKPLYEKSLKTIEDNRQAIVKNIPDIRLQKIYLEILEDGEKYVNNIKRTASNAEIQEIKNKLQADLNLNGATLPSGVKNKLQEIINIL